MQIITMCYNVKSVSKDKFRKNHPPLEDDLPICQRTFRKSWDNVFLHTAQ